jgi:hypothetical protein
MSGDVVACVPAMSIRDFAPITTQNYEDGAEDRNRRDQEHEYTNIEITDELAVA